MRGKYGGPAVAPSLPCDPDFAIGIGHSDWINIRAALLGNLNLTLRTGLVDRTGKDLEGAEDANYCRRSSGL